MEPPGYRSADRTKLGTPVRCCHECVHERQFEGRSACLKHLIFVKIFNTCDEWDGGVMQGRNPEVGLFGKLYFHNSIPSEEEMKVLKGSEIADSS